MSAPQFGSQAPPRSPDSPAPTAPGGPHSLLPLDPPHHLCHLTASSLHPLKPRQGTCQRLPPCHLHPHTFSVHIFASRSHHCLERGGLPPAPAVPGLQLTSSQWSLRVSEPSVRCSNGTSKRSRAPTSISSHLFWNFLNGDRVHPVSQHGTQRPIGIWMGRKGAASDLFIRPTCVGVSMRNSLKL